MNKQNKQVEIKKLTVQDATPEIVDSLWKVATSGFGEESPWTANQLYQLLTAGTATILTANLDQQIVGLLVASTTTVEADIYMVVVDEEYKQQGIGQQLFYYLIEDSTEKGLETIFLEVRESNTPAYRLYQSLGFQEIGRRRAYYSQPIEDALMMKLDL